MSQPPTGQPDKPNESGEHHSNVCDESRPTLNADVEPPEAVDLAHEERLEILIESDVANPQH